MAILDALKTDVTIQEDNDSVGGFSALESDVYSFTIERAFVTLAASKAMALNVHMVTPNKEKLRTQFYMTSGEAKGCKNFYISKRDGSKHYLPGFNQANALCLLTVGKEVSVMSTEKKTINLYDPAQKKEVPTEVDMIMDLIGKQIFAGVIKQIVDKRAKDPNTGEYLPTSETRVENEVDKFFRAKDKLTVVEIKAQKTEVEFMTTWSDTWKGKTKDKTSKTGVVKGAPKRETGKQAPATSLFT